MMKYVTLTTQKRIEKIKKEWTHTSVFTGEQYGAFVWNACETLKDILSDVMNWCGTCDIKERRTDNNMQIRVQKSSNVILRVLESRYPDLVSCNFCLDINSVTITDFNKLVRVIEKDADKLNSYRWF